MPIKTFIRVFVGLALLGFILSHANAQSRYTGKAFATRSEVIGKNGMIATSQPLATQAGLEILKQGGTAMDAAIAANALLGVVEPTGNGIGGDIFAIVWDAKTQRLYGFNGSGRSPYSLTSDYFKKEGMSRIPGNGPLAVSVPGCVDGWYQLHERFGSIPMQELLQPAIHYATEGYPVTEVIAFLWAGYARSLQKYEGFKTTYMPDGRVPVKGEIFKNPGLARALTLIAAGGRDAFYTGEIGKTLAATVQREGGFISEKDLADHKGEWVDPVSTNYRGYDVWELPPNGQGIAALQMLNILEGYDIASMGYGSTDYLHRLIEAKKASLRRSSDLLRRSRLRKYPRRAADIQRIRGRSPGFDRS